VNRYPFIEAEKAAAVTSSGRGLLKVSRAACYAARDGQPCDRDRDDAGLIVLIKAEHRRSRGRYGARRSCAVRGTGIPVSESPG
jgi:putative transposase